MIKAACWGDAAELTSTPSASQPELEARAAAEGLAAKVDLWRAISAELARHYAAFTLSELKGFVAH